MRPSLALLATLALPSFALAQSPVPVAEDEDYETLEAPQGPPPGYADPAYDAQQFSVGYVGSHPVPYEYGSGYCYVEGAHTHEYAPFDQYLFREFNGYYYFVGDPADFGYAHTVYGFNGNHPIPGAWGGGYCYMSWGHRHPYEPVGLDGFSMVGGYYIFIGVYPADYYLYRDFYWGYYGSYYRNYYYGNRYYSHRPPPIYRNPRPIHVNAAPGRIFVGAPPPGRMGGPSARRVGAPPAHFAPGVSGRLAPPPLGHTGYRSVAPQDAPPAYRAAPPVHQSPTYRQSPAPVYHAPAYRPSPAPVYQAPAYRPSPAPVVRPSSPVHAAPAPAYRSSFRR
ncbi:MAG: hypothetical protein EXR72_18430 [Myxococcales bacterium]|nr:hypothetical protein [Myxococcales bacterium]